MDIDFVNIMEFESDQFHGDSPPSSPILGYSRAGNDKHQSIVDNPIVYSLCCKGPPKTTVTDNSFSPEGYILRREVISAIDNLSNVHQQQVRDNTIGGTNLLVSLFDSRLFDLLELSNIKTLVNLSRKNISTLEILCVRPEMCSVVIGGDDVLSNTPWALRQHVCTFLSFIVRNLRYYNRMSSSLGNTEFYELFHGLKKSLGSVKHWSTALKSHCGYKSGNECSAANYHWFHLQLELRWNLLLIFLGTEEHSSHTIQWVLNDLVDLAFHIYNNYNSSRGSSSDSSTLDSRQPFNCVCVKEIWTMILLVLDEVKVEEKTFWDHYSDAMMRRHSNNSSNTGGGDVFFPIWLTAYLAQSTKYTVAGVYDPDKTCEHNDNNSNNNRFKFLQRAFKEWANHGGKSAEILRLSCMIFYHWGGDLDIVMSLWNQWTPRLNKPSVISADYYSSVDKWVELITKISQSTTDSSNPWSACYHSTRSYPTTMNREHNNSHACLGLDSNEQFLEFVKVVATYASSCTDKDFKKLKGHMFMRLSRCKPNEFGEIGIIRVCTLILALMSVVNDEGEAIFLGERLQDTFQYSKVKEATQNKTKKTVLLAYSSALVLLQTRNIGWSARLTNQASKYMQIIDDLLGNCNASCISPLRKDLVMIYVNFIESLVRYTPQLSSSTDLGRSNFISHNLLMWLANTSQNYVLRLFIVLGQLSRWVCEYVSKMEYDYVAARSSSCSSSSEAKQLYYSINRFLPFLTNFALSNANRLPSTDVQPMANLAAEITYLTAKFNNNTGKQDSNNLVCSLIEKFGLNVHVCPLVSQHYVSSLFRFGLLSWLPRSKQTQIWTRLVFLDCDVPDSLTYSVLEQTQTSTSNEQLLLFFCSKFSNSRVQQQQQDSLDLPTAMSPCIDLLKAITDGSYLKLFSSESSSSDQDQGVKLVNSVVRCSTIVLEHLNIFYTKGLVTSCGHRFLDLLVPQPWPGAPPWEKLPTHVLRALGDNDDLYRIFVSIIKFITSSGSAGVSNDSYLSRKLKDIVAFMLFGFVRDAKEVDVNSHPLFKLHNYCEDHDDDTLVTLRDKLFLDLLDEAITNPKLQHTFLAAVQMIRSKPYLNLLLPLLSGIIRVYPLIVTPAAPSGPVDKISLRRCVDAIFYSLYNGHFPTLKPKVLKGFEIAFEKDFNFRGKTFLNLCLQMVRLCLVQKQNNNGYNKKERILGIIGLFEEHIVPLLIQHIELAEMKRGRGEDASLRSPLDQIRREIKSVQELYQQ